ncbi:MAG: hypothetical protein FWF66_01945 [Candidatus Bathyarchaeota archaeon]|nr:hypothetical protein [Candidatus Termiticorpusculum sp.]
MSVPLIINDRDATLKNSDSIVPSINICPVTGITIPRAMSQMVSYNNPFVSLTELHTKIIVKKTSKHHILQ